MSYYVIADEDTVLGFRYAGVDGTCPEGLPRITGVESIPVPALTDD